MAAPKGHPRYGGRQKGSENKITVNLKEMIETALSELGGASYLVKQAKETPASFIALLGKTLPRDVNVAGSISVSLAQALEQLDKSSSPKPSGG